MQGDQHPDKVAIRRAREAAIERLTAAFVADELSLEQFEDRVDRAYRCRVVEDLAALTQDLSGAVDLVPEPVRAIVPARSDPSLDTRLAQYGSLPPGGRTIAVLGNTERGGHFQMDERHAVLSVLGNVEMDLRDVELGPGVTTLHVRAVLGNVEITVPPTLIVACDGAGVLGSFSGVNHVPDERSPDEPVLRIVGSAVLGSVEVRTRPSATRNLPRLPSRER